MHVMQLITGRMVAWAAAFGAYGLWVGIGLPGDIPTATRVLSWLWAIGLFGAFGILLGGVSSALAVAVGRRASVRRLPAVAATVETAILAPVVTWLVLNEATYRITSEVVGYETLLMVWANPAATFEGAWEMGGRYVLLVGGLVLVGSALAWSLSRRSFRRRHDPHVQVSASAVPRANSRRLAGSMTGGLALVAGLFAWQFCSRPSAALTVVCRSAPPLRALNLTRALLGDELRRNIAGSTGVGPPVITDAEYQAILGGPRQPAPNVVLIVLESVPAKALHCYGHPRADITPHLDRLAAEGVLFEHCWATASFSSYGLVSVMTSLYMLRAESNDHFADTSFPFLGLPRALKLAGYELALFSSGNEAFDNINRFYPPEDFDTYFSLDVADVPKPDCMRMQDHYAVERFESWISARKSRRPFYCGFYLQSTHFNYEIPEPWAGHYQPVPPLYSNGSGILQIPSETLPLLRNQYDNAMRYSDHWIGRIRAALERADALDNAIVVVVGDHGEAFMEHGLARHGVALWEEMIHIPLIVHVGPQVRQNLGRPLPSRVAGTVSGVDIAPTIAGLVHIHPHPSWQGVDVLAPGYDGAGRPVFSVLQLTKWQEAVVVDGLKYTYDLNDVRAQLFDLAADPGEREDLIGREPGLAAALQDLLADWHSRQLDYYANRPFTRYLGPHQPGPAGLARLQALSSARRSVPPVDGARTATGGMHPGSTEHDAAVVAP